MSEKRGYVAMIYLNNNVMPDTYYFTCIAIKFKSPIKHMMMMDYEEAKRVGMLNTHQTCEVDEE